MSQTPIVFSEIRENGKGFYGALAGLALFALIGFFAFLYLEHHGHYVTGMNNQIVWGLPHVFAIFLIVTASGALNVSSISTVFAEVDYQPLSRLSVWLAVTTLLGGLMVLVLDLGHADRLIVAMTHYNFSSIFAWNILLYNGFLALGLVYLWAMMERKANHLYRPIGFAAFFWRLILTTGTGSIFGFLIAREAYSSAIMAGLFIAMSLEFGLAVVIVLVEVVYLRTHRELSSAFMQRLGRLLMIFIGVVVFFEVARHLTKLYAAQYQGVEHFLLAGGNVYSYLFWIVQIGLGTIAPIALLACPRFATKIWALPMAAGLVIVGGLAQLYVIIVGGQAYPLSLFPNAEVESSFFDGQVATYTPSIWELMLGLGGVAVALLLLVIGMKALRLLPVGLADRG